MQFGVNLSLLDYIGLLPICNFFFWSGGICALWEGAAEEMQVLKFMGNVVVTS